MKIKLCYLTLCLIVCFTSIYSQETISKKFIEPIQENSLFREKVFLHVNKSTYFTNETIWIKAYVAEDALNTPSIYSSNLIINLYDSESNLIDKKTLYIQKGVGIGDFLLDSDLKSGTYFIKAFTNYMLNFGNENVFSQEIEIINSKKEKEIIQEEYTTNFDVQLFPESGYLLEGVENVLGIKALINGKGYPFTGKIINSKEKVVATFTSNRFGMGKSVFNYEEGETYTAIVNINKTIQKVKLPTANKTGVVFSVASNQEQVILTLKTNQETLPLLKKANLDLIFYRNNYISEALSLKLINSEQTTQELIFDKSKLLDGVNIVTLFKNNEPIAERKFFIEKEQNKTAILINKLKTENDSISFKIKTINSNLNPIASQLSISVLPNNSSNFKENQTIKSAFLLTPYVKGEIENPSYYFNHTNPTKTASLDLLLMNQGWSTYSLEEKMKEINPTELFKFESGFTLNGKLKWNPKGASIGILSDNGRLAAYSEINKIDKNREFTFKNVFGFKNDTIKVTLINNKSTLSKPASISFSEDTVKSYVFYKKKYSKNNTVKQEEESFNEVYSIVNQYNYPDVEVLKQVVLKNVKSKRKRTFYDDEMDIASRRRVIAAGFYDNHKVTERISENYLNLLHYFQQLGMVAGNCPNNCILKLRGGTYTFNKGGRAISPNVFINDVRIDGESQIEMFQSTNMEDVDEILINRTGAGGGIEGVGGIVKIYLKKGDHKYYKYGKTLYQNLILKTGFDKASDYFEPQYNIYSKEAFNWSEITWINNMQTNVNGEAIIKIPKNAFSNDFQFIINGFSEQGLLFNAIYKTTE
ncbi:hypothetical protein R3X25_03545 [Lutibacter sp. TH_r2]|uniref:hypothetical protein n=1 Tax=Lutibacter sp. TH_r2 TaxID=3082083 RepID=UPI002954E7FA|nr:hypothetical protein [Lutibacter sp. TH_r2]MDV7186344.1 hypothetical protein [Lutibacter sp. TH_r2]